jgi:p-cumate 2,3-dioxygenase beta subunit
MPVTRDTVETFLYREAALLDEWKLEQWLGLFTKDGQYLVPPMDVRDQDPEVALHLVDDDYARLQSRVKQLLSGKTYSEAPFSRTRRIVSNALIELLDGGRIRVMANFMVNRFRHERIDTYIGRYDHVLVEEAGELRFRVRRAILDLQALRPHAKLSIIL